MNEIEKAQQEITEARDKLASAEARLSALSKPEKEYRAGEWVPKLGSEYWLNDHDGTTFYSKNSNHRFDKYRIKSGNAFPRKPIAEAAKAHADWWREFDLSDDGGEFEIYSHGGLLDTWSTKGYYGNPKFTTKDAARAAIERLGGEQKVIEMLTAGRVFRFTWGGQ